MARGNRRFLVGVGVSIAVHVLLMFAYRHTGQFTPVFEAEPAPIEVTIRPAPPPPPPPPRVEEPPQPRAGPAAPRSARRSAPKRVIAVPQSRQQEASADPFVVQQPEEAAPPGEDAPKFDMDAAKQTARQLAGQTKLGREGTALAQFPEPALETESKFAKAISKAKRRNCKDGIPGGLLAPLFLAMDKKNSGCKW